MIKFRFVFIAACTSLLLISCLDKTQETDAPSDTKKKEDPAYQYKDDSEEVEAYAKQIDDSTLLNEGNSLYYSRPDGQSLEVEFKSSLKNEILKIVEEYTKTSGGSILSNHFYYKNGKLYLSKEYFDKGFGETAYFVERVSYYDEKEEPIVTKERTARFEEALGEETFKLAEKSKCSDERAKRALSQKGEFETNFTGFVEDGPLRYLMVGENKENGYETAILVQYRTLFIQTLFQNQKAMIGTKLIVNFETIRESTGFSFQSLIDVREAS